MRNPQYVSFRTRAQLGVSLIGYNSSGSAGVNELDAYRGCRLRSRLQQSADPIAAIDDCRSPTVCRAIPCLLNKNRDLGKNVTEIVFTDQAIRNDFQV